MVDGRGKMRPDSAPSAVPSGARVAVAVARWNEAVTEGMLAAARATLADAGLGDDAVDVVRVPGSFELPLAADRLAATGRYAAVICLGAIIRGETSHDRHIASAVAAGIEQAGRARGVPILFGVLTCDTPAQAAARSGGGTDGRIGNKGAEAAAAALEMIAVLAAIGRAGTAS